MCVVLAGLSSQLAVADEQQQAGADASALLFQNVCASCHGKQGEGREELKAPSIAGLPDWYVRAQLGKFRNDQRGAHPKDVEGQMMRAIAQVLTAGQSREVARYVAALPRVAPKPTIIAPTVAGRELYAERCMECHRYNAEGELFFGSPPLVGLQDWYLAAQMRKYQHGIRGADPKDENGQKMIFSSQFVEDETLLRSLVAYLVEMQQQPPLQTKPTEPDPFEGMSQRPQISEQPLEQRQ